MKTLVVYYSRSGNTRRVAQAIAGALGATLEELQEARDRSGALGYIRSGIDAVRKKAAELMPLTSDPVEFDLVVIGTPVWAFTMAPAVRTYIQQCGGKIKRAAVFCTLGSAGQDKTFRDMAAALELEPAATLALTEGQLKKAPLDDLVAGFVQLLQGAPAIQ
jgi:flavodoxin